jgi:type II secretory pathway pseudopilin PulG
LFKALIVSMFCLVQQWQSRCSGIGIVKASAFYFRSQAGWSLVDLMVTLAVFSIVAAGSVPVFTNMTESVKLSQGLREVERELQTARLKAVTANRPIRVRFNCPVNGEYRMVELIGTPSVPAAVDDSLDRCKETAYPMGGDGNPLTRPNHDGPQKRLANTVAFGAQSTLEFWPDGSVHKDTGSGTPWPVLATTGTAITLTKGSTVKSITVNGLGKITLVP